MGRQRKFVKDLWKVHSWSLRWRVFWSFYVAEPSDFPFQAISLLLEAF